jgi:hypothetical protein
MSEDIYLVSVANFETKIWEGDTGAAGNDMLWFYYECWWRKSCSCVFMYGMVLWLLTHMQGTFLTQNPVWKSLVFNPAQKIASKFWFGVHCRIRSFNGTHRGKTLSCHLKRHRMVNGSRSICFFSWMQHGRRRMKYTYSAESWHQTSSWCIKC